ncbi:MAG: GNAT family N-acetyltransferase [Candidatus Cloacimonetes bacterium]|nr:GNAT family N-acetyltransferase [Candidatus Cloacimonadota bacterium]
MAIEYLENNKVTAKEIMQVFESVGWNKSLDNIVNAFQNSWYITAYDNDKLIAFARAISDNHYYTSIFDVVVMPEYQKRGIAKEMMKRLIERFQGTYFFLTFTEGNRDFYAKCGFQDNISAMWIPK